MYNIGIERSRRRRGGCCLPILLILVLLIGTIIWTGVFPLRYVFHFGPLTIPVGATPQLIIKNDARNSNSLRQVDAAPLHLRTGSNQNVVSINASNIPVIGWSPIDYRQSADHNYTFITVDYRYKGTIEITVPKNVRIAVDSYENSVDAEGITGKITVNTYKGDIHLANCLLTLPSYFQTYQGSVMATGITLQQPASFKSYQGNLDFQGTPANVGHHFFYTYQGSIKLQLPANSVFAVSAKTYAGSITTDFPGLRPDPSKKEFYGTLSPSARTFFHLETYKESVTIQREKGA